MIRHIFSIIFLAVSLLSLSSPAGAGERQEPLLVLKAEIDADKIYEGQPVSLIVRVFSSTTDIDHVNLAESVELGDKLHKMTVPVESGTDGQWVRSEYKGTPCYSAIVFRTVLLPVGNGSVTIGPMKFRVGLIRRQVVNDPFWGPFERDAVSDVELSTDRVSFKISPLPASKGAFSGAIGDFTLKAILPPGDIQPDQEVIVVYRLSGFGSLVSAVMPDIKNYLPEGVSFRSETKSESVSLRDGRVWSVMEVEVTLYVSDKGNYIIPPVETVCFSPDRGKYVTVRSAPLTIRVGGAKPGHRVPNKIYQI